jgi:hypothetical protein
VGERIQFCRGSLQFHSALTTTGEAVTLTCRFETGVSGMVDIEASLLATQVASVG